MLKGYGVTIHNKFTPDKPIEDYNISYHYYILQAKKNNKKLKKKQLSLWDFS